MSKGRCAAYRSDFGSRQLPSECRGGTTSQIRHTMPPWRRGRNRKCGLYSNSYLGCNGPNGAGLNNATRSKAVTANQNDIRKLSA
jgi:hypothetical protein